MNGIRIFNNSERVVIVREVMYGDGMFSRETWVLYPMSSSVADTAIDFMPFVQEATE